MVATPLLLEQFLTSWRNLISPPENEGFSPVTLAAREGCVDIMLELMAFGANSGPDKRGCTPLEVAITSNKCDSIRALAKHGVDLNKRLFLDLDIPPVNFAIEEGHTNSLKTLLECDANENILVNSSYPIHLASAEGNVDAIRVLVAAGVDVNLKSHDISESPMHYAAATGQVDAIRTLIELGGHVDSLNDHNCSPFLIAAKEGHVNVLVTLADFKADVNITSGNGDTPMHFAAKNNHVEAIRILAKLKCPVNKFNYDGDSPLHTAAREDNVAAIQALAAVGADFDVWDNNGWRWPPLHVAVNFSQAKTIMGIIAGGVNIDADTFGLSALDIAVDNDLKIASNILVNCGANVASCVEEYEHGAASVHPDKRDNFCHINEMMSDFYHNCDIPPVDHNIELFTLTKLMMYSSGERMCIPNHNYDFEVAVGSALQSFSCRQIRVQALIPLSYTLKAKLVRLAWKVCSDSLLIDGDRIDLKVKAQRYVELVSCLFHVPMLKALGAIRLTCVSCNDRRRFPVCFKDNYYCELEANLIESFIGYDASRFIPTGIICGAIDIHTTHSSSSLSASTH